MNQDNEFLGKNIIVTGASSGIGQSVALYFLNCGANVILAGQDIKTMENICKKYNFPNAIIMKVDFTSDMMIYDFKTSVVELIGKPDILINCAGLKFDGDIEKTFPQDFDFALDINLRAVYVLIKNLAGFLNEKASIINMSCLYGTRPMSGMISQCVSKAGLEALTRYTAAEFAPHGIRVNAVTACPVDTNSLRYACCTEEEITTFKKKMENYIPMGRIARPDDIVKAIIFLASQRSSKITGQVIKVDGGRSLTSSGYVHYKGMNNMNTRFEPDAVNLSKIINDVKSVFTSDNNVPPKNPEKLKKYVEEKIKESNFSTRITDAHKNVHANYKFIDPIDDKLKDKYLEGKTPNPLYDVKDKMKKSVFGRNEASNINSNYNINPFQNAEQNTKLGYSYNINYTPNNKLNNQNQTTKLYNSNIIGLNPKNIGNDFQLNYDQGYQ